MFVSVWVLVAPSGVCVGVLLSGLSLCACREMESVVHSGEGKQRDLSPEPQT